MNSTKNSETRIYQDIFPYLEMRAIIFLSGLGAVVARTSGGREVASSILVALTIGRIISVP